MCRLLNRAERADRRVASPDRKDQHGTTRRTKGKPTEVVFERELQTDVDQEQHHRQRLAVNSNAGEKGLLNEETPCYFDCAKRVARHVCLPFSF